ncbi:MAG: uracil-DNA glycosylase family protein, partial [Rubrivivax sp.]
MPLDDGRLAMLREMGVPFWRPLAREVVTNAGEAEGAAAQGPAGLAPQVALVEAPLPVASRAESSERLPASGPLPAAVEERAGRPATVKLQSASPDPLPARESAAGAVLDVTGLDWPALRQAVADCRACGLCEKRRQTVFGVGHPQAHWMVVGEAPGEQEDLRGEPFVGPAGRLLDQMLAALGLTRAEAAPESAPALTPERQVYIANTLKCRPPGNRKPEPAELARCEPYLVRQIELVQPRVILAMGRFAVQALLRTDEPIGRLRGRVHRYQGVPLIVTYHPAYLLRNRLDTAKAWDDLCLAMDTMEA